MQSGRSQAIVAAVATLLVAATVQAQTPNAEVPNYHRADVIRTAARYVFGTRVRPSFLEDSVRFWYTSSARDDRAVTYVVDPERATKRPLFDNARLASALSLAADTIIDPTKLPRFAVVDTGSTLEMQMRKRVFRCRIATYACESVDSIAWSTERTLKDGPDWATRSPDKKWDVFRYNYDLYVRPAEVTNREAIAKRDSVLAAQKDSARADTARTDSATVGTDSMETKPDTTRSAEPDSVALPDGSIRLTMDGEEHHEYGRSLALWSRSDSLRWKPRRPVSVEWSPDSRKVALQRHDYRNLRRYPLYSSTEPQPEDHSYLYAVPGDSVVPQFDVYVIDVDAAIAANVTEDVPEEEDDGGSIGTPGIGRSGSSEPQERMAGAVPNIVLKLDVPPSPSINFSPQIAWSRNAERVYFMSSTRGYKRMSIHAVDTRTGTTAEITRDSFPTWVETPHGGFVAVNGGEDILYVSERDGWSHIYRFGADGTFKNQVESGPYRVDQIVHVDSIAKHIYFSASGKEEGNPYYSRIYRINFDGTELKLLTPEEGQHWATFIPKANYFIDTWAPADAPSTIALREAATGKIVLELAKGDVELLGSFGWTPPEVIQVKARDGVTDLWGLLYKPSDFDSTKSYPIIDHIYPGPQVGSVRSWSFTARHEPRALAELGFIVLELDHMGTPGRSKAFHDFYYGNMGDNGIPDHVAAIRQLAAQHRWIDVQRVGIYGHSGGGFASTGAILRYPDFYKVAVSSAGNHDNRTYGSFWGEKYQGIYEKEGDTDNYEASANYTLAGNLKGKLLLMHGDLDNNVHPANTLRVVDALIKANKNFDMILFPDAGHGLPDYATRKQWDYFVRHLLGVEPPEGYRMMERPPLPGFEHHARRCWETCE